MNKSATSSREMKSAIRPTKAAAKATVAPARKASSSMVAPGKDSGKAARPKQVVENDQKQVVGKDKVSVKDKAAVKETLAAKSPAVKKAGPSTKSPAAAKVATLVTANTDGEGASGAAAAGSRTAAAAPARTAETKSVAAALMAARRKVKPAAAPANDLKPQVSKSVDTVKGTVEVADKNVDETVFEHDSTKAPVTPVKAVSPQPAPMSAPGGMMRRPGMPQRSNHSMVPAPVKVANKSGPKGQGFKTNEFIVYPAHGVGEIVAIEEQEVAGYKLELFVISFVKDKMILKVPLPKIASVGMRKLAEPHVVKRALDTLTGRARIKRTMWSRRAQEYEAKINSGDLVSIAEVVRDLYRSDAQPEQSYSERQLYEAALDRMAREIAVVQDLTDTEALKLIDEQLRKGPRRGKAEDNEADEADEAEEVEGNIGEAA